MIKPHVRTVPILLFALIALLLPASSPRVHAQSGGQCSGAIDQLDRDVNSLQREADRIGIKSIHDESARVMLKEIKADFAGRKLPAEPALKLYQEHRNHYDGWRKRVATYVDQLDLIMKCYSPGSGCDVMAMWDKVNDELRRWAASFGDPGTKEAAARVKKGADAYQKYSAKIVNTFTKGATATVEACGRDYEQRANAAARANPLQPFNPGGGGGAGLGTALAITAGLTAAGAGAAEIAAHHQADQTATGSCKVEIANSNASLKAFGFPLTEASQCCHSIGKSYVTGAASCSGH